MLRTLAFAALLSAIPASPITAGIAPGPILSAAPSQYVTVDGARVHYKTVGRGRTAIVFVHGWGGEMNVWREQVAALHMKARLVLIDLPGHGLSGKPKSYSVRGFANAVNGVLTKARVEHAVLVGHSMGALVVRTVDRFYPARAGAVVSVDGAMRYLFASPEQARGFANMFHGDNYQTVIGNFFNVMLNHATPELREEIKSAALATPHEALTGIMDSMVDPASWKEDKISVPVLVVAAASPQLTPDYEQYVRELGPDVTYEVIPDADHFLFIDSPAVFNAKLEAFLLAHKWIR